MGPSGSRFPFSPLGVPVVSSLSSLAASADRALRTTDGTGSSWLAANEQVLALVRAAGPELPASVALLRSMARPTPLADRLALVAEVATLQETAS